jgi:hypothetical protein
MPNLSAAIKLSLAAGILLRLTCAYAEPTDDSLRIYAVNVVLDPPPPWTGRGVYLGKGLVITASHVVGLASQSKPSVQVAGMYLPAHAIKEGSLQRVDLTLLSIDEKKLPISLQMRRMPLCENHPWPGEPVIVAVPEETLRSYVMSPAFLAPSTRLRFSTVISDVAATTNSGSGVFDAGQKCLLGIVSQKISRNQQDIAKYFVPAPAIRAFIPTEYRF